MDQLTFSFHQCRYYCTHHWNNRGGQEDDVSATSLGEHDSIYWYGDPHYLRMHIQKRSRESACLTVLHVHGRWPERMGGRVTLPSSLGTAVGALTTQAAAALLHARLISTTAALRGFALPRIVCMPPSPTAAAPSPHHELMGEVHQVPMFVACMPQCHMGYPEFQLQFTQRNIR